MTASPPNREVLVRSFPILVRASLITITRRLILIARRLVAITRTLVSQPEEACTAGSPRSSSDTTAAAEVGGTSRVVR
ncbi:MAG: hypothetical protein H0W90_09290 [Actinobacteria bacterium]|nr:hypothetical protein [Actinomycetota bacterium]